MEEIKIIVGSESGTSEQAACHLRDKLKTRGYQSELLLKPTLNDLKTSRYNVLLIVTATAGVGELPKNLRMVWRKLKTKCPDLRKMDYAIAVLGDSSYGEDFCKGGIELDMHLEKLGANRLDTPFLIDSENSSNNPDVSVPHWGIKIIEECEVQKYSACI